MGEGEAPGGPRPAVETHRPRNGSPGFGLPGRRAALLRSGVVVGVLLVVFGVILPRYVDYEEVIAAFRALAPPQVLFISGVGATAWLASGLLFAALIPRMSAVRGAASWLILGGVGSSIPLGPWNMGVLWVVVRGWGFAVRPATTGIALYGVVNQLGRLALPLLAVVVLALTGDIEGNSGVAWLIAIISTTVLFVAVGVMMAVVRSDRAADTVAHAIHRLVTWVLKRLRRPIVPNVGMAVHRFRDQLGDVVRERGRVAMLVSVIGQVGWYVVLIAALRVVGVSEDVLSPGEVLAVYALVNVITIIPIAPGGAGIPELLYIAGLSAIAGEQYESMITAGVFLMRLYQWFLPIPIAWILLKLARRGRSILPTTAELRAYARDDAV
jgi:uncharacterized membrane protein YbhN (UPF0104 family)